MMAGYFFDLRALARQMPAKLRAFVDFLIEKQR